MPRRRAPGPAGPGRLSGWAALLLIVAIGVNVRAIFGATPTLVPVIIDDLGLSAAAASLLTALPVLAMGVFAPLGNAMARRLGPDWAMIALFSFLALVELSRLVISAAVPLVVTAGVIGGALGALSALAPAFIGHHLPSLRGLATGVYSTSMALGVGLAAGTARPLTDLLGSWQATLSVWGLTALLLVGALCAVRARGVSMPRPPAAAARVRLPLGEARAWFLTATYSVAMILGFGVIPWLPSLYIDAGIDPDTAASYLVAFQCVQVLSILTLTPLTDRITGRRGVFATVMLASTLGLLLLVVDPAGFALPGALLAGFGVGGISSLALVKVQDEARDVLDATRLSALAMLFSFTAGAASPLLIGALRDLTGSFVPGFSAMLGVSLLSFALLIRMTPALPRSVESAHTAGEGVPTPPI